MFRVGFAEMVAYRAEMIVWILTATLPLVMMLVWDRVAQDGAVGRFGQADFARYFVLTLVVRQLTASWVVWELNEKIRTGALSTDLLRPVHPLMLPAAENLSAVPFRAMVLLPIVAAVSLWRPELWQAPEGAPPFAAVLPVLLLSMALGWALNFAIQVSFASLAFWLGQSLGIFQVWFGLWAMLSGYLVPVELIPTWVGAASHWAPFRAVLGVPAEMAAGLLGWDGIVEGLAIQWIWLGIFAVLGHVAWSRGLRRFEAYGS
jgi:ABC-2 type transport system permease protein